MITANRENLLLEMGGAAKERFWSKVNTADTGCWEWSASKCKDGYGTFTAGGYAIKAHRAAYALSNGEIPSGMVVRHSCHNPSCCNPDHLSIGTQRDNIQDMLDAGRQFSELRKKPKTTHHAAKIGQAVRQYRARLRAEGIPHSGRQKLTDEQVRALRFAYGAGAKLNDLSHQFGICKSAVIRVVKKRTYAHVA
jgi:hypothetical protein